MLCFCMIFQPSVSIRRRRNPPTHIHAHLVLYETIPVRTLLVSCSPRALCSLFSLFPQRVFANSFAVSSFHTLFQNCRRITCPAVNSLQNTEHLDLIPFLSHSSTLFCTSQNHISFLDINFWTLCAKTTGGGVPPNRKPVRCSELQRPGSGACGEKAQAASVEQHKECHCCQHGKGNPQTAIRRAHEPRRDALRSRRERQDHLAAGLPALWCHSLAVHLHAPRRIVEQPQPHSQRLARCYTQDSFFGGPSLDMNLRFWRPSL